jgi:IPT/TIG domain
MSVVIRRQHFSTVLVIGVSIVLLAGIVFHSPAAATKQLDVEAARRALVAVRSLKRSDRAAVETAIANYNAALSAARVSDVPGLLQSQAAVAAPEVEPNNTSAQATVVTLNGQRVTVVTGSVSPASDIDYYTFTAAAGAKVWAYVDTGGDKNPGETTRDSTLVLIDSDGQTEIETDEDDGLGCGCTAQIDTTFASVIGGATLPGNAGTMRNYYLKVTSDAAAPGVIDPYKLYLVVTTAAPQAEVEPNDSSANATPLVFSAAPDDVTGQRAGRISTDTDADYFSFPANAGEVLFISADGEPARDGNFLNPVVDLIDRNGFSVRFTAGNSFGIAGVNPPAEGFCYAVATSGTYYLRLTGFHGEIEGGRIGNYTLMVSRVVSDQIVLNAIAPTAVIAGTGSFLLTAFGANFTQNSVIQFNGSPRPTTFVSSTRLTTNLPAGDIANTGTANITVSTPTVGTTAQVPLTINTGYEADVSPRSFGDNNGQVGITDWVQVGRFAAGLDMAATGTEFQRADCDPKGTSGNGVLNLADWVQAGRYAAGLDAPQPGAGPTAASGSAGSALARAAARDVGQDRSIQLVPRIAQGLVVLAVELNARGDENGASFSLNFDPRELGFVSASSGSGLAINVNATQASAGRVGLILAGQPGESLAWGHRVLALITFTRGRAVSQAVVTFGDSPVERMVVAPSASSLGAQWVNPRGRADVTNRAIQR